ncbi:putative HAD-like hydrolase [Methyloglobulus morosus KoM1]|uniref:Putative HAD-like hydrolase n=1 Tax=Methyloglobulus morosus KoM1 TaxID=1116472 RepID=V5C522_9GAMM|nr:HAD-IIB family hydrolase [Methyloglobulus morosus]ESS71833.1 putative HAD-like hydrolase [Methyloglobulus morosus KoM1]
MPKRLLICTDLDRTLLPNGSHPESPRARETFARLVMRPEVMVAYVSGRHRALVEDAIREYQLPMPDWVIGDVGTTIYRVSTDEWLHSDEWEQYIASDWQSLSANDIQLMFSDLPSLRLQEESKQNHYKLSYYLPLQYDNDSLQQEMNHRLTNLDVAASLIYSIDEAESVGLLDVLPARASKLHAVEFLMQRQGFDFTNTVFAGDSGNDLLVLASRVPSVLVANSSRGVVEKAQTLAREQGTTAAFYLAKGDFLGMNGNYSAGIVEGVAHYHPEIKAWIK